MLSHLYLLSLPPARNINLNHYLSHYVDWLNGAPQNIIQEKFPIMCLLQLFLQQMKYQMCVSGALLEYGAHSHGKGFQVLTFLRVFSTLRGFNSLMSFFPTTTFRESCTVLVRTNHPHATGFTNTQCL